MAGRLSSLQVGTPKTINAGNARNGGKGRDADGDSWMTAFYKHPVKGPVRLARTNLAGDLQADLAVHGGTDKAVCVYPLAHYAAWRTELATPHASNPTGASTPVRPVRIEECGPGWFGENFTIDGQVESSVAIGDRYRIGTAIVEVSQPRSPCWKLAARWELPDLPKRVVSKGRTGWYLRVLEEGVVEVGDAITRLERPHPKWTIEAVNTITYWQDEDLAAWHAGRRELAACPALAQPWRDRLHASR